MLVCPQPHRQSFQSTLPYESDLNTQSNGGWISEISIHAPLRERLIIGVSSTAALAISIHAPLRERPLPSCQRIPTDCISIHAPLRERQSRFVLTILSITFQSTLPYGSDSRIWSSSKGMPALSIHVPLRERQGSKLHAKRGQTFQSTLPCGSDG